MRYFLAASLLLACVALASLGIGGVATAKSTLEPAQEERANKLEYSIMAACCMNGTIADHSSPVADQQRAELRRLIKAGYSDRDILTAFADNYGPEILSSPPASGFNLLLYIVPILGFAGGAWWLWKHLQAMQASPAPGAAAAPTPSADEGYQSRLQQELREVEEL